LGNCSLFPKSRFARCGYVRSGRGSYRLSASLLRLLVPVLLFAFGPANPAAAAPAECVNIFYDRGPSGYWMGKAYAIYLQNLLGHFPQFQQVVSPIELYRKGDIEKCRATFYLASYFENKIPQDFYDDYAHAGKNVAWFGYSIWKTDLEQTFGQKYVGLTKLDSQRLDPEGRPTFFKWIDYKGETFFKYGDWNVNAPKMFMAPFEQVEVAESRPGVSQVLAWARHGADNRRIPYALRAGNHFYVADIPFSFIHEGDRYLIIADLLFDILNVQPTGDKLAALRIEDIHALTPLGDLLEVGDLLRTEGVPGNIALIPIFFDPYKTYLRPPEEEYLTMDRKPEFLSAIQGFRDEGYSFLWHGVTHQYETMKNPHTAASGDDFEFWDAVNNRPVPRDAAPWLINRLADGFFTIQKSGLQPPFTWLTPHYQASALDYLLFARLFPWNAGRVIYFQFKAQGLPDPSTEGQFWFRDTSDSAQQARLAAFSGLKVTLADAPWNGQFFPYEIYGDIYGQRLIPENLGNSQPYISEHVVHARTAADIVADAKRNSVIRDAWAVFFYHPYLLDPYTEGGRGSYPGDAHELQFILQEIKKMGYRFVSLDQFAKSHFRPIRPEPIYREEQP
jgi:uncharacterized protein YdaL